MTPCPTEQQRIRKYMAALISTLLACAFLFVWDNEHSISSLGLEIYFVSVSIFHWWTHYKMQRQIDIKAIVSSQEYSNTQEINNQCRAVTTQAITYRRT